MKAAPDAAMSDVVRQRLEVLLAEIQPRHALEEEPGPSPGVEAAGHGRERDPDAAGDVRDSPDPVAVAAGPLEGPGSSRVGVLVGQAAGRVVEFTSEHLVAVVIVLLVGCGWTVYSLLQARSTPVAVAAVPSVVASPTPTPAATTPAPAVLVHVLGAVKEPGIVELAQGSRVADAIAAAGGLSGSADPGELNLAAVVDDGSQVVIGTKGKPRGEVNGDTASAGTTGSATVSLNTATLEQLDTLPGVGPVTAQKILDWREQHGRFTAVSELQEIDGIGPKTYADIAPNVRV